MFFIPNQSLGFGLYFCFILSGFSLDFSLAQWTMSKKYDKKTPIENKKTGRKHQYTKLIK